MVFFETPEFWYKDPGLLRKVCLKPFSEIYRLVSSYRYHLPYKVSLFNKNIIAVGGITVGGSGKTVVVNSICKILKEKQKNLAILSRGYGRSSNKALKVDNIIHTYRDVGDEPLLLSKQFDVFVGADRSETADLADNYDYLILDDGITQKDLKPTKKIIIVNEYQMFGNGEMFPLGPNRLDFEEIKSDIDAVIVLRDKDSDFTAKFDDIPVCYGTIEQNFNNIQGRLIVFCGLGYPQKFFKIFSNFEVAKTKTFPDHYPYKDDDIKLLLSEAFRLKAQLVTTEKDLMRIPQRYWSHIETVGIEVSWENSIDFILE